MGRRPCYNLCLVLLLVLHNGLVHSMALRVCSLTRVSKQYGSGLSSPMLPSAAAAGATTESQRRHRRRTWNMVSSSSSSSSSSQQNDHDHGEGAASLSSRTLSPAKAVVSSLLATAVVLTGVVPGWEVQHPTTFPASGVPAAAATTFNTEQAAIAETWVRGSISLLVHIVLVSHEWLADRLLCCTRCWKNHFQ